MALHGTAQSGGSTPTTLTGAVTGTGTGTVATTITAKAVTYAKIQDEAATSLLGNPTGSPAAPSEITAAGGLAFSGTTLTGAAFNQKANNLNDVASVTAAVKNLQGVYILAQSAIASAVTATTGETTLATITLPAGAMGANGCIDVEMEFSATNNANAKTVRVKFGGTQFMAGTMTSAPQGRFNVSIYNRNATNSQVGTNQTGQLNGLNPNALITGAIDTTASVTILITGQLGTGTDTLTLESSRVLLYAK